MLKLKKFRRHSHSLGKEKPNRANICYRPILDTPANFLKLKLKLSSSFVRWERHNQASYQEWIHLKTRGWTTSIVTLQQSEQEEAAPHIPTPDFQTQEFVLAEDTTASESALGCAMLVCGQTYDLSLHTSDGVVLFERTLLLACWKNRSPFGLTASSQSPTSPPGSRIRGSPSQIWVCLNESFSFPL